jgi:cytochrome c biogenesis factor
MIPELGNFALILALCVALAQGTLPLIGAHTNRPPGSRWRARQRSRRRCCWRSLSPA